MTPLIGVFDEDHNVAGYRRGCRCSVCKACWAEYIRLRYKGPGQRHHGTIRKFDEGCECGDCVKAFVDQATDIWSSRRVAGVISSNESVVA